MCQQNILRYILQDDEAEAMRMMHVLEKSENRNPVVIEHTNEKAKNQQGIIVIQDAMTSYGFVQIM